MERGFTLIEVLVALSIAAFALTALMGRMGASVSVQQTLMHQRDLQQVAQNLITEEMLSPDAIGNDHSGTLEWRGQALQWRAWSEKTELEQFVRRNVAVRMPGEPEYRSFVFMVAP